MNTPTTLGVARPRLRPAMLATLGVGAAIVLSTTLQLVLVQHYALDYAGTEAALRLQQLSWQMRDSLDRVVAKASGDVQLVAALATVREAHNPAAARAVLDSLQDSFPDYAWIGIANLDGKVVAATHGLLEQSDVGARPWFRAGRDGLRVIDYHPALLLGKLLPHNADPWRFIDIAAPVRAADGQPWGVLGVHLSWNWARRLARNLLTPALKAYGAEILVVRDDATVLLGPAGMEEQQLSTDSLRRAQAGQTGALRETWPDGKVYLTGYSQTGQRGDAGTLQWSVLVRQPEQTALASWRPLQQRLWWISSAGGMLITLAAALLARRLARTLARRQQAALDAVQADTTQLRHTLDQLASYDPVSELPNRRALMLALPLAQARSTRVRQPCALLCLSLDHPAQHDRSAHGALLRECGARVVATVRRTDLVAHFDDQRLVLMLENLSDGAAALAVARKLLAELRQPMPGNTDPLALNCAIGVALHLPDDNSTPEALLARACSALEQAQLSGANMVILAAASA